MLSTSKAKVDASTGAEVRTILFFGFFTLALGVLMLFFLPIAMNGLSDPNNSDSLFGTRLFAFQPFRFGIELSHIYAAFIICSGITSFAALCVVWKHYFGRNFFDFFVRRKELKYWKTLETENASLLAKLELTRDHLLHILQRHPVKNVDDEFSQYVDALVEQENRGYFPFLALETQQFKANAQKIFDYGADVSSSRTTVESRTTAEADGQADAKEVEATTAKSILLTLLAKLKERAWPF